MELSSSESARVSRMHGAATAIPMPLECPLGGWIYRHTQTSVTYALKGTGVVPCDVGHLGGQRARLTQLACLLRTANTTPPMAPR